MNVHPFRALLEPFLKKGWPHPYKNMASIAYLDLKSLYGLTITYEETTMKTPNGSVKKKLVRLFPGNK